MHLGLGRILRSVIDHTKLQFNRIGQAMKGQSVRVPLHVHHSALLLALLSFTMADPAI